MGKKKLLFDTKNESHEIQQELGNRKKFHLHDLNHIQPLTKNQEYFLRYYLEETPVMAALGSPGTGKSYLSLYCALRDVFDPCTPYRRIVLIRSAVQGRDQGALPGELEEKMAPYENPYVGIVSSLMPRYKDAYNHLKSLGYLYFESTSFLRSATFDDTVVIVSEAQNCDFEELVTCITRVGNNSRIIIEGDERQIDLHRKREKSGLPRLQRVFDQMPYEYTQVVKFSEDDIVRSGVVKEFIIACNAVD